MIIIVFCGALMLGALLGVVITCLLVQSRRGDQIIEGLERESPRDLDDDQAPLPRKSEKYLLAPRRLALNR